MLRTTQVGPGSVNRRQEMSSIDALPDTFSMPNLGTRALRMFVLGFPVASMNCLSTACGRLQLMRPGSNDGAGQSNEVPKETTGVEEAKR